jgi:hypothetical protein
LPFPGNNAVVVIHLSILFYNTFLDKKVCLE